LLTKLVILDLSENDLKEIPPEISQLKELNYLDITGNNIKELPEEIGSLNKLSYLSAGSLEAVRLEKLPTEIGQLTNLKKLDLRFCSLNKLPKELGNLHQLTELDLWQNEGDINTSMYDAFENFPKKVIISANVEDYFFTDHPDTLVIFRSIDNPSDAFKIKNLIELQLNNYGYYKIPKAEIDFLRGVEPKTEEELAAHEEFLKSKTLNWSGMRFTEVPEKILMFNSLETLDLTNNQLLEFPEPILLQMQGLKKLHLSGNPIILLSEKAMAFIRDKKLMPADSVAKYNVDATKAFKEKGLTSLPDILWKQEYLAELYLNDNNLSKLPGKIAQLKELGVLNLNNNQLSHLPDELSKMEHLSELYLENNQLTKLPDFSKLHSLEVLNLKNNKLTTVAKPLKKLKYLRKLDLRGNKIPENEIEKLKKCMVDCEILY
jgi:leucine-rich repeat protein SHOC2